MNSSQIEGGLTLRVSHDAAAPFRYRVHEVAGADSEERTENESFITLVDEQDVPLAHATVDSANESLPGEAKRGTVKLTWATESARKLFEAPVFGNRGGAISEISFWFMWTVIIVVVRIRLARPLVWWSCSMVGR